MAAGQLAGKVPGPPLPAASFRVRTSSSRRRCRRHWCTRSRGCPRPRKIACSSEGITEAQIPKMFDAERWLEVRAYLVTSDGTPWPKDTVRVMDYLRRQAEESCGRTGPRSILQTLAFVAVEETCGTAPAPRPPPGHGRPTTSGEAPKVLVYFGALREVPVVPLPGLCPVKFLSCQVPDSKPCHLGVLLEVSEEALQGRVQGPTVAEGEGASAVYTTTEEEDGTTRSKEGAGEDTPAEVTTSEEGEDCTARSKKGAGPWCSGARRTRETGRCVASKGHPRARPSAARLGHEFSNVVGDQGWEQVPSGQNTNVVCPASVSGDRSPGLRWHFRPNVKFGFLWRHVARGKVRFRAWQSDAVVLLCWEQTVVSPRGNWRVKATYGRSVVLGPKVRLRGIGLRKPCRVVLHDGNRFRCESRSEQFRGFHIIGVRTPGHRLRKLCAAPSGCSPKARAPVPAKVAAMARTKEMEVGTARGESTQEFLLAEQDVDRAHQTRTEGHAGTPHRLQVHERLVRRLLRQDPLP